MSEKNNLKRTDCQMKQLVRYFVGDKQNFLSPDALKRNAEYLTILMSGEQPPQGLNEVTNAYHFFYEKIIFILHSFPQYYRLILSIGFELAILNQDKSKYGDLCNYVIEKELYRAETSDMRRLETQYLLSRHDPLWCFPNPCLRARVMDILSLKSSYLRPNRDLFYTFTHAVFYLTKFGETKLPLLPEQATKNLMNIGSIAYLMGDNDLLAEVIVCLVYLSKPVPDLWREFIVDRFTQYTLEVSPMEKFEYPGEYHSFLVCYWCLKLLGDAREIPCYEGDKNQLHFVEVPDTPMQKLNAISFDLSQMEILDRTGVQREVAKFCDLDPKTFFEKCRKTNPDFDQILTAMSHGLFQSFFDVKPSL